MILKTRLIVLTTHNKELKSLRSKQGWGILEVWEASDVTPESMVFRHLGMDPTLIHPIFIDQIYVPGIQLETIFLITIPHKELPNFT